MYKAIIRNSENIITHEPQKDTLEDLQSFVASHAKSYGTPAYWILLDENTDPELVPLESDRRESIALNEEGVEYIYTEILIPDNFTVEYVDISSEVAESEQLKIRSKKRQFSHTVIDYISYLNDSKSLTLQQVQDLTTQFDLPTKLLLQGSLDTARSVIAGLDLTTSVFTEEERNLVLNRIDTFLNSL